MISLYDHQQKAVEELKNGSILVGDVGSGKSATAIAYYIRNHSDRVLFIITTAKKRDSKEWEKELKAQDVDPMIVQIDSWNNIKKYIKVYGAFFIFDEQRVVGKGAWVKAFLKIACKNQWILLSATPGDKWEDYAPVFIANGFYRNRTDFNSKHLIFNPYTKYPQIDKYINTNILNRHMRDVLVIMKDKRETEKVNIRVTVEYDKDLYLKVWRERWDVYDNVPIKETGKLFYLMRKVVNANKSRLDEIETIMIKHKRVIIFYNFTYELELMKEFFDKKKVTYSEWNGQKHQEIPKTKSWVYLVQYTAGAEGWNCIETDTIIFYSQTYSYRSREQAKGRIDRLNTPYKRLYYYHLISYAPIDIAILKSLKMKKNFNEQKFMSRNAV